MFLQRHWRLLSLLALGIVLYCIDLNVPSLTDPDDVFYAESSKEMLNHGSVLTPLIFEKPQFEKPPLYFWLLMASFKTLGVNAFAARLVPALFAIFSMMATYGFVRKVSNEKTAFWGAIALGTSIWWIGLSHVVLTDMVFSTFIMLALYCFFLWFRLQQRRHLIWFALCTALASLTKTPLGLLLPMLIATIFLLVVKDRIKLRRFLFGSWWGIWIVLTVPWYIYAAVKYGNAFLWEFFVNCHWNRLIHPEHEHFNTLYFYPGVIVTGFLPWTCFLPFIGSNYREHKNEYLFSFTWIVVTLVFFSISQSKLSTYISPIFPGFALAVALATSSDQIGNWRRYLVSGLLVLAGAGLAMALLIVKRRYPDFFFSGVLGFGPLALALIVAGILFLRSRAVPAMAACVIGVIAFVILIPRTVFPKLETALSDSDLPKVISEIGYARQPILCDKLYVRGVYFYSENPVVIISGSKKPFWSMHPIEIRTTDEELTDFIGARDTLLAVLTGSTYNRFNHLTEASRVNSILSKNLDRLVVLSIRKPL